jgi:hypothetical protein
MRIKVVVEYEIRITLEEGVKSITNENKDTIKFQVVDGYLGNTIINKKGEYIGYWDIVDSNVIK